MKRIYLILLITVIGLISTDLFAGNWQRAGQAGASLGQEVRALVEQMLLA